MEKNKKDAETVSLSIYNEKPAYTFFLFGREGEKQKNQIKEKLPHASLARMVKYTKTAQS